MICLLIKKGGASFICFPVILLGNKFGNAWSSESPDKKPRFLAADTNYTWMNYMCILHNIFSKAVKVRLHESSFPVSCARCRWNSVQWNKSPLIDAYVFTLIIIKLFTLNLYLENVHIKSSRNEWMVGYRLDTCEN